MRALWISVVAVVSAGAVAHADAPAPRKATIRGKLRFKSDGQPIPGGTVTVSPVAGGEVSSAISDEHGDYTVEVEPGAYKVTIYYLEVTIERSTEFHVARDLDIGETVIDETRTRGLGLVCFQEPSPEQAARPYFGLRVSKPGAPVSRDRTHRAWLGLVAGADERTLVTTLGDSPRLHGAPAIPSVFVEQTQLWTMRAPITHAGGSGGVADVTLRSGSNSAQGDVRIVSGLDRTAGKTDPVAGGEAFAGTPLVRDRAWLALGLAADAERRVHGLARFDTYLTLAHQAQLAALVQDTGLARDGWASARWTSKLLEHKLELHASATAEQLELTPLAVAHAGTASSVGPALVNRAGGAVQIVGRKKARGHHEINLVAAAGAGGVDGQEHRDLSLAADDSWQVKPNLTIEIGVRSDTRRIADARATVVSPRLALAYDHTREGRAEMFIAYQRVPRLDDGHPGAWRTAEGLYRDEVAAGWSQTRERTSWLMTGLAARAVRREGAGEVEAGLDGWVRIEKPRTSAHLSASTLRRAAALHANTTLRREEHYELLAASTIRTAQTLAGETVIETGAALSWRARNRNQVHLNATAELHDGTLGPGGRLIVGGSW